MPYYKRVNNAKKIVFFSRSKQMKSMELSKAMEGFLMACQARKLSVHTYADYKRTLIKFEKHVGNEAVNKITTTQVTAFLAAQPHSAKTVLNYHIGLSAFWTWMMREGYVEKHILHLVEKPRPQQIAVEPFSEIEIRALLQSLRRNPERDRAIILLLLDTGIRASELCGLTKDDIDLTNRHIKVLGKGNKERLIPFSPRTASALFRHMADSGHRPFPMTRTSLAHLFQQIKKRAGILDAHPHRFRHTFSITYLKNGGDPYTLQDILGHTTMEMVRRYLALAQVDIDAAHRKASPVEGWKL